MNKILEALKSREWEGRRFRQRGPDITIACCPTCGNCETEGHKTDCTYAEAIREAERLPKRLTVDDIEEIISIKTGKPLCINAAIEVYKAIYGEEPDHDQCD